MVSQRALDSAFPASGVPLGASGGPAVTGSSRDIVRPARPEDLDAVVEMTCLLARETVGKALPHATARAGVRRVFESPSRGRYYVACLGGEVVGQIAVLYVELNAWRNGLVYWVDDVYVRPAHRGRGVFRRLFAHVRDDAQATPGVVGIRLHFAEDNRAAEAAYRALGMRRGGMMMEWFSGGSTAPGRPGS